MSHKRGIFCRKNSKKFSDFFSYKLRKCREITGNSEKEFLFVFAHTTNIYAPPPLWNIRNLFQDLLERSVSVSTLRSNKSRHRPTLAKNVHSKCFDWIITPSLTNATTRPKPKLEIRKQQMNSISPVSIYSNVKTAQQRAG